MQSATEHSMTGPSNFFLENLKKKFPHILISVKSIFTRQMELLSEEEDAHLFRMI
jgi:hypothetical protein